MSIVSGKLKDVFEMLRFDVSVQLDKTASEIKELMAYFSTQVDHAAYNCFVCFILTHGKLGKVYGSDGATVDIMRLTSCFKGDTCPSLVGKPKLFFVQACQGTDKQTGALSLSLFAAISYCVVVYQIMLYGISYIYIFLHSASHFVIHTSVSIPCVYYVGVYIFPN